MTGSPVSARPVPPLLYLAAAIVLSGGIAASTVVVGANIAFGLPRNPADLPGSWLLMVGPAVLALAVVLTALRLWRAGWRRTAAATLVLADALVLLVAAWLEGVL